MDNEINDAELIEAYLAGDAAAFSTLYDRYKRQLYAYLNKLLQGQTTAADDLFQQTWLRAIDKLPVYRSQEKFLAWLMRIAHNLAIDLFRAAARRGEECFDEAVPDDEAPRTEATPWKKLDNRELAEAIDGAVAALTPELREVFLLRQDDIPFREIARIQHCSINTCLARMQYALKKLRSALSGWADANKGR